MEYIDAITLETVHPDKLVHVQSGDTIHYFDIETLYRCYADNNQECPINPFTRQPLSTELAKRVIDYGESLKIAITCEHHTFKVEKHKSIGYVITTILTMKTPLDVDIDVLCKDNSLYLRDLPADTIMVDTCITLRQFINTSDRINAMKKLAAYTKERQYDKHLNNYAIYYQASLIEHSLGISYTTGLVQRLDIINRRRNTPNLQQYIGRIMSPPPLLVDVMDPNLTDADLHNMNNALDEYFYSLQDTVSHTSSSDEDDDLSIDSVD